MKFKKEISVGNILTIVAITITIISFGYNWNQNIQIQRKEQANKVRDAAAITLAKIERWEEISLSFYKDIQPVFVTTSEQLGANHDVIQSRDYLWRELNSARNTTQRRILDEELHIAYVGLFSYHPTVKSLFEDTLHRLSTSEEKAFTEFLIKSQDGVLSFENQDMDNYQSAQLGDILRFTANEAQTTFEQDIDDDLTCLTDFLTKIILKTDEELLNDIIEVENCHPSE